MNALPYVLLKIMAIFYFVKSLFYIESLISTVITIFSYPGSFKENIFNWVYLGIPLLMILTSIFLWVYAKRISDYIVKGMDEAADVKYDFDILLNLSLIIVGIVLVTSAIPNLVSGIYSINQYKAISNQIASKNISDIIAEVLRLLFGVWFVFRFRGLGDIIKRLGRAGVYSLKDEHAGNEEK